MGNLCCAREHSVQLFVQYFYAVKLRSLTLGVWSPLLKTQLCVLTSKETQQKLTRNCAHIFR